MARQSIQPTTELGRHLEKERRNRGVTGVGEWAELFDVSRQQYGQWLRGAKPGVINIIKIAEVLGITTIQVFAWVEQDFSKGVSRSSVALVPAYAA